MMWILTQEGDRNSIRKKRETGKYAPSYIMHQLANGEESTSAMGRPAGVRLGGVRDNRKNLPRCGGSLLFDFIYSQGSTLSGNPCEMQPIFIKITLNNTNIYNLLCTLSAK